MIARFFFGLRLGFALTAGAASAAEPGRPWLRTESLRREAADREPGRDGAPEALATHGRLCREPVPAYAPLAAPAPATRAKVLAARFRDSWTAAAGRARGGAAPEAGCSPRSAGGERGERTQQD